jgi:hypothetical protein
VKRSFLLITIILIIPHYVFSADIKAINGEIIGIGPKKISISSEEIIKQGEIIKITRGEKIIAYLKVTKVKPQSFEAEILTQFDEIDFSDKIVKEPLIEKPQEKKEETTPIEIPVELPKETQETKPTTEKKTQEVILEKPKSNIIFGYSIFAPQNIEFSNSGYLFEFDYPIKPEIYSGLQYSSHSWKDKSIELNLNLLTLNIN